MVGGSSKVRRFSPVGEKSHGRNESHQQHSRFHHSNDVIHGEGYSDEDIHFNSGNESKRKAAMPIPGSPEISCAVVIQESPIAVTSSFQNNSNDNSHNNNNNDSYMRHNRGIDNNNTRGSHNNEYVKSREKGKFHALVDDDEEIDHRHNNGSSNNIHRRNNTNRNNNINSSKNVNVSKKKTRDTKSLGFIPGSVPADDSTDIDSSALVDAGHDHRDISFTSDSNVNNDITNASSNNNNTSFNVTQDDTAFVEEQGTNDIYRNDNDNHVVTSGDNNGFGIVQRYGRTVDDDSVGHDHDSHHPPLLQHHRYANEVDLEDTDDSRTSTSGRSIKNHGYSSSPGLVQREHVTSPLGGYARGYINGNVNDINNNNNNNNNGDIKSGDARRRGTHYSNVLDNGKHDEESEEEDSSTESQSLQPLHKGKTVAGSDLYARRKLVEKDSGKKRGSPNHSSRIHMQRQRSNDSSSNSSSSHGNSNHGNGSSANRNNGKRGSPIGLARHGLSNNGKTTIRRSNTSGGSVNKSGSDVNHRTPPKSNPNRSSPGQLSRNHSTSHGSPGVTRQKSGGMTSPVMVRKKTQSPVTSPAMRRRIASDGGVGSNHSPANRRRRTKDGDHPVDRSPNAVRRDAPTHAGKGSASKLVEKKSGVSPSPVKSSKVKSVDTVPTSKEAILYTGSPKIDTRTRADNLSGSKNSSNSSLGKNGGADDTITMTTLAGSGASSKKNPMSDSQKSLRSSEQAPVMKRDKSTGSGSDAPTSTDSPAMPQRTSVAEENVIVNKSDINNNNNNNNNNSSSNNGKKIDVKGKGRAYDNGDSDDSDDPNNARRSISHRRSVENSKSRGNLLDVPGVVPDTPDSGSAAGASKMEKDLSSSNLKDFKKNNALPPRMRRRRRRGTASAVYKGVRNLSFRTSQEVLGKLPESKRAQIAKAQMRWRALLITFSALWAFKSIVKAKKLYGTSLNESIESGENSSKMRILRPSGGWIDWWNFAVFLVIMYNVIMVPFSACFHTGMPLEWYFIVANFISDAVMFADIYVKFHTGYYSEGTFVMDVKLVRHRYLHGWFPAHATAQLPMDWIALAAGSSASLVGGLRLPRLLNMLRFPTYFNAWESVFKNHPILLRFIKLGMWILLLAHFVGCVWYAIGAASLERFPPEGWLVLDRGHGESEGFLYLRSLYWAVMTMTTVGYGDIRPVTDPEYVFSIFVMIIGQSIYAFIIGNMSSLIAAADSLGAEFAKKIDVISSYVRYRRIPSYLSDRIFRYFDYVWSERRGISEGQVLKELPLALRGEVMLYLVQTALCNSPLFKNTDKIFMTKLISKFKPVVACPGDVLIHQGEVGFGMYVILKGTLNVISVTCDEDDNTPDNGDTLLEAAAAAAAGGGGNDAASSNTRRNSRSSGAITRERVLGQLHPGDVVGELSLVHQSRRSVTVRANVFCDLYFLHRADFASVYSEFPDAPLGIDLTISEALNVGMSDGSFSDTMSEDAFDL